MGKGQHGSKSEATHTEHAPSSGSFIAQLTRCLWLSVVSSSSPTEAMGQSCSLR
jgi:hypothetical protein